MGPSFKLPSPLKLKEEGGSDLLGSRNVVILTKNFTPTKTQLKLLEKGLTFIPVMGTIKDQKMQLQLDIQNYHRKLKLASYFKSSRKQPLPFTPASFWTPSDTLIPRQFHKLISKDVKDFNRHFKFQQERMNMSPNEIINLKQLINNKNIVIKPADKGSAVVIMGRDQYITEVNRQLNNTVMKNWTNPYFWRRYQWYTGS